MSNDESPCELCHSYGIRHSTFGFFSSFGFRHSSFATDLAELEASVDFVAMPHGEGARQHAAFDFSIVREVQLARIKLLVGEHFQAQQFTRGRIGEETALDAAVDADQAIDQ